ncbi:MAG: pentapeptide repeat-containing protein [Okeania sp. SIO3I5]|uniref:pentapeptide repeat-containing protein n=1 Tax=Okeania sp. SIO3I5 TaxID=2607805 RepID=UPI0013BCF6B8|nr:pentapeptide repeat-containing protein [Okeania sp. SIO3I5]NEQ36079.1 pentapeptide repeat-containing protein [Okeania sp. SIO3I5]
MKRKRKRTSKEKKLEERIEKLRQQGFYFPPNIQSPNKKTSEKQTRLIRRFADWWETTPVEKFLEDIHYLLKNSAILDIFSLLTNVAIIVSLVSWLTGLEERKENKLFSTWTIINDGKGDQSGVVRTAVERLYKDKFSLSGLQLNKTNLSGANFSKIDLSGVDLSGANLLATNLSGANLLATNLSESFLFEANLSGANLLAANLSGANFGGTKLNGANLFLANLSNTQIKLACNWKEATYVSSKIVDNKWVPLDKQANQDRIKEIEQDKDSDPKNPPDCSKWE